MKALFICGSLRKESLNLKLLKYAKNNISKEFNFDTELLDLNDFQIPLYDGDIESKSIPSGVIKLGEDISKSDLIIISSPEYNKNISGVLKNTFDWISRIKNQPLKGKKTFVMGASPGKYGAIRAIDSAKNMFRTLGANLIESEFSLSFANKAFDEEGNLEGENKMAFEKALKAIIN